MLYRCLMNTLPIPHQPDQQNSHTDASELRCGTNDIASPEKNPVVALKELVARLRREQNKTQDLLISLGFALRSFNNLNQFLELIPLIASRVTDADSIACALRFAVTSLSTTVRIVTTATITPTTLVTTADRSEDEVYIITRSIFDLPLLPLFLSPLFPLPSLLPLPPSQGSIVV